MYTKEGLKKYLLDSGYGVYAYIVDTYRPQIKALKKPARFRRWLAEELDIPFEKINLKSLNSAVQQQRKKDERAGITTADSSRLIIDENDSMGSKKRFEFSKPSSEDDKDSRIQEI